MSKSPVDTAWNLNEPVEGQEKENTRKATLIAFRVKVNQVLFFKRMADHFCKEGLIAMANYVQKKLNASGGPNDHFSFGKKEV